MTGFEFGYTSLIFLLMWGASDFTSASVITFFTVLFFFFAGVYGKKEKAANE